MSASRTASGRSVLPTSAAMSARSCKWGGDFGGLPTTDVGPGVPDPSPTCRLSHRGPGWRPAIRRPCYTSVAITSSVNTDAKRKRAGLALRSARRRALAPYTLGPDTAEVAVRPPTANVPSSRTIVEMPIVTSTTAKSTSKIAIVRTPRGQAGEPARGGGSGFADPSIASHRRSEGRDARSDPDTSPLIPHPAQVPQPKAATHEERGPPRGERPPCPGPISPDERPVRRRAFRSWSSPCLRPPRYEGSTLWVELRGLLTGEYTRNRYLAIHCPKGRP